jgi:hypothetical protein
MTAADPESGAGADSTSEPAGTYHLVGPDHVQLAMSAGEAAVDQAVAFYSELLGLERVPTPPQLEVRGGRWFENGSVGLHLAVGADFRAARNAPPALLVEGLDALLRRAGEGRMRHRRGRGSQGSLGATSASGSAIGSSSSLGSPDPSTGWLSAPAGWRLAP